MSHENQIEQQYANSTDGGDGSTTTDFFSAMLRRKWIVAVFLTIGLGLGSLSYNKSKVVYESSAQLVINHKEARLPSSPDMVRMAGSYEEVTSQILSTQAMVIRSPVVIIKAVREHNLGALPSLQTTDVGVAASVVLEGLTVGRGGASVVTQDATVLTVSYRGSHPADCARIVNAVLESYQDFLHDSMRVKSTETARLISDAYDRLSKDLSAKEQDYTAWRRTAPLILLGKDRSANPHAQRLADVEAQRSRRRLQLAEIRANFQVLDEAIKSGAPTEALQMFIRRSKGGIENTAAATQGSIAEQQLVGLMMEEQLLIEKYGGQYPKVLAIRKQIELIQDIFLRGNKTEERRALTPQEFLQVYLESMRQEIAGLEREEQELTLEFEREREQAKNAMNFELEDERRRAEINRTKELFDDVRNRLREMDFVKDFGGYITQVISAASAGIQIAPKLPTQLGIFGSLGVLVGFAFAYMVDLADKSFRTPDEIRNQLKIPVVGHIPVIEGQTRRRRKRGEVDVPAIDPSVVCYHRPRSSAAEAYRAIRTALYFGSKGADYKVVQITSADAGDGKTTLSCNLAVSIAQSGRRVCLMDADYRRSRLHTMFAVGNALGSSNVIAGTSELKDVIVRTEVENLWMLPCGPRPANPSELVTSQRFKEMVDALRAKFDVVIIDTPPMLAVTDPSAVAPRVDGVLLVMRITKHVRPSAQRAKEVLDSLGANVLGCVVNGIEVRRGYGQHDYGYRRYGSGYGYREYGDYYDEDDDKNVPMVNPPIKSTG